MYDALSLPSTWMGPLKPKPEPRRPLDDIVKFLNDEWPELADIPGVYLAGGQVWRRVLGYPVEEAKDIDFFCVNPVAMARVEALLEKLCEERDDESPIAPSVGPLGGGVWFTKRGRVDLWTCQSVNAALRAYSDAKAHVRMAFNARLQRLIWLPAEIKRKPGERYIHFTPERQERSKVDGVMEIHSAALEWREWPE